MERAPIMPSQAGTVDCSLNATVYWSPSSALIASEPLFCTSVSANVASRLSPSTTTSPKAMRFWVSVSMTFWRTAWSIAGAPRLALTCTAGTGTKAFGSA